jgi:hypothetical protein
LYAHRARGCLVCFSARGDGLGVLHRNEVLLGEALDVLLNARDKVLEERRLVCHGCRERRRPTKALVVVVVVVVVVVREQGGERYHDFSVTRGQTTTFVALLNSPWWIFFRQRSVAAKRCPSSLALKFLLSRSSALCPRSSRPRSTSRLSHARQPTSRISPPELCRAGRGREQGVARRRGALARAGRAT